jgi:hypothetical protein
MIEGALITGGICLSYWLDFGFSFLELSTIAWRFPIGFQNLFALIILAFTMELPESLRWYEIPLYKWPVFGNYYSGCYFQEQR